MSRTSNSVLTVPGEAPFVGLDDSARWQVFDPQLRSPEAWTPWRLAPTLGLFTTRGVAVLIDTAAGEPFVCEYVALGERTFVRVALRSSDPQALADAADSALQHWRRWRVPGEGSEFAFNANDIDLALSRRLARSLPSASPTQTA